MKKNPVRRDHEAILLAPLTLKEVLLLAKCVHDLQKLEAGQIAASTPSRERFVKVCQGKTNPVTEYEIAYTKWRRLEKPDLRILQRELSRKPVGRTIRAPATCETLLKSRKTAGQIRREMWKIARQTAQKDSLEKAKRLAEKARIAGWGARED